MHRKFFSSKVLLLQSFKARIPSGFTLLELLTIMIMIGILVGIMVPSLLFLLNLSRLNIAQDDMFQSIKMAQSRAKQSHLVWQFSIQQQNNMARWAIHPANSIPLESAWSPLDPNIRIDEQETTFRKVKGIHRVQFNHLGRLNGLTGRVTFVAKSGGKLKRCVVVSTLLGAMRKGTDHAKKDDGKFCY